MHTTNKNEWETFNHTNNHNIITVEFSWIFYVNV